MKKLPTEELLKQLNSCNSIDDYFKKNSEYLIDTTLAEYLYNVFEEKCLKKSRVFEKAEIDSVYGYQIIGGKKTPSRNKLLALVIAAGFTLNEIQATLKIGNLAQLSPHNKRDSLIIFGINNKKTIPELNELLYKHEFETL